MGHLANGAMTSIQWWAGSLPVTVLAIQDHTLSGVLHKVVSDYTATSATLRFPE